MLNRRTFISTSAAAAAALATQSTPERHRSVPPLPDAAHPVSGCRRTGDVALVGSCPAMTRPSVFHHLAGLNGTWSRIIANATRLARCPRAQATTPGPLPRASSSLA